jgi:hypothetical protein
MGLHVPFPAVCDALGSPEDRVYHLGMTAFAPDVPGPLVRFRTYTLKDVAALLHKTPRYLYRCIRSAQDEKTRATYGISLRTLQSMPVLHWFRQGGQWVIRESDLFSQLRA